jgi:hypothetical protein
MMLQRLTFNGRRAWQAVAKFVRYVEATVDQADQGLNLFVSGTFFCTLQPGDEVELDQVATDFEVIPRAPGLAGVLAAGTSRLTPGTVSGEVGLDSGWRATLTGRQAVVSIEHTAAAGQFPVVVLGQLQFPIIGYVNATIRSLLVTNPGPSAFTVRLLQGNATGFLNSATALSKLASVAGTFGLRLLAFDAASAAPATIGGAPVAFGNLFRSRAVAADFEVVRGSSPYVLNSPTGDLGLAIIGGTAGASLTVNVAFENANRA